jgi:hypothetical protein
MKITLIITGILICVLAIGWQATLVTNASWTCVHCGQVKHKVTKILFINKEWIDNRNDLKWTLTNLPQESSHQWILNGINKHRFGKLLMCGIGSGESYGELFKDIDWCGRNGFINEALDAWTKAQDSKEKPQRIRSALAKTHENIGE